jgi:hypothetical protein
MSFTDNACSIARSARRPPKVAVTNDGIRGRDSHDPGSMGRKSLNGQEQTVAVALDFYHGEALLCRKDAPQPPILLPHSYGLIYARFSVGHARRTLGFLIAPLAPSLTVLPIIAGMPTVGWAIVPVLYVVSFIAMSIVAIPVLLVVGRRFRLRDFAFAGLVGGFLPVGVTSVLLGIEPDPWGILLSAAIVLGSLLGGMLSWLVGYRNTCGPETGASCEAQ